jgi:phage shock protein A
MQNLLVALVAGLVSAGAAIGAVSMGLVPTPDADRPQAARVLPHVEDHLSVVRDDASGDVSDELRLMNNRVADLELRLSRAEATGEVGGPDLEAEIKALRTELNALKARPSSGGASGGGAVAPTAGSGEVVTVERLDTLLDEREARRREEGRAAQLDRTKEMIANFTPRMVEREAERLNIPEVLVPDVTEVIVAHSQKRAEINHERQSARLAGDDIDETTFTARLEQLDRDTKISLGGIIDSESAESLLSTANRPGGAMFGGGAMGRGGAAPSVLRPLPEGA